MLERQCNVLIHSASEVPAGLKMIFVYSDTEQLTKRFHDINPHTKCIDDTVESADTRIDSTIFNARDVRLGRIDSFDNIRIPPLAKIKNKCLFCGREY